uniref:J domain-containing protein n=1 Tax=Spongospora subterranea TaxID=70186 RepID=A0A0H5RST8_9EUKA|eukprot:CRZ11779.1 hypothetical protein [Spongospora subterranea]
MTVPFDDCLYDVLGVKSDATQAEIGAVWRKLAILHHPDKGGDQEKFKAIRRAYDVLRNKSKRQIYDRFGMKGVSIGLFSDGYHRDSNVNVSGPSRFNLFNLFRTQSQPNPPNCGPKGPAVEMNLALPLEILLKGASKRIKLKRQIPCHYCRGTGCRSRISDTECLTCDGFGAHVIQLRIDKGPDDPRQREEKRIICPTCDGLGIMVPHSQKCEYCCGRRLEPETVQVTIDIPAGSRHGDRIVINGVADQLPYRRPGDLVVVIDELQHERFRRVQDDLVITDRISLVDALTGASLLLRHLDGRLLNVKTSRKEILSSDNCIVVPNEGFPKKDFPIQKGNLYIRLQIEFPKDGAFDRHAVEVLKRILPQLSKPLEPDCKTKETPIHVKGSRMKS